MFYMTLTETKENYEKWKLSFECAAKKLNMHLQQQKQRKKAKCDKKGVSLIAESAIQKAEKRVAKSKSWYNKSSLCIKSIADWFFLINELIVLPEMEKIKIIN